MDYLYILAILVILYLLTSKKEGFFGCDECGERLDYYGYRKCQDWAETVRRRGL